VNHRELVIDPYFDKHPDLCEGALDIEPRVHFEVQRIVQQHIDNAVSKTINLPPDYAVEDLSDLWLEYLSVVKGTTLYRSGSRGQEPLELVPAERYEEVLGESYKSGASELCASGVCELPQREVSNV
jgi:ribonucleoside-diphosphate reductase alpha chain